jgi:ABC-2 type transport system permease protein
MNKIPLIISREYLTRVKKKSFLVMTILGPILFAALFILPAVFASMEDKEVRTIAVIDSSKVFINTIPETEYLKFVYLENTRVEDLRENFNKTEYYAVLYISHIVAHTPSAVQLLSDRQPSLNVRMHISNALEKEIERQKLQTYEINNLDDILSAIKTRINIRTIIWQGSEEKESMSEVAMIVGYISGFLIYIFIFLFGGLVMRGVIEEKTSRVVEILVSSVKPFQLMAGKIVGIGLVGLTQFLLWVVLTFILISLGTTLFFPELKAPTSDQLVVENVMVSSSTLQPVQPSEEEFSKMRAILDSASSINFTVLLGSFLFFFLGGYLLYASLFAAIGSAVDNEADTQQFMLPITIPLILAIIVMMNAIQNPEGQLAFWFSMIPFTSPIIMMVRIPFGVPLWEAALSMSILVATFLFTTWVAAKIYRTGILMYGKKVTYKELWKWLRYSN